MSEVVGDLSHLFGSEGIDTTNLRFSDANLIGIKDQHTPVVNIEKKNLKRYSDYFIGNRHGIRVSSETKTTEEGSLFNYEYINPNLIFAGEIELDSSIQKDELKKLLACLFHMDRIGGQKSRGLGKVKITVNSKDLSSLGFLVDEIYELQTTSKVVLSGDIKKYSYSIQMKEDAIFKSKELDNNIETLNYIQGSSVRGALIKKFSNHLSDTDLFQVIKTIKIGPALPINSYLTPASYFKSKYPVVSKVNNKKEYEYYDMIFSDPSEKEKYGKASDEKTKLERFSSTYIKNKEIITYEKRNTIGVTIDSITNSSKEGQLFNKEVLEINNNKFTGTISLDSNLFDSFKEFQIQLGKQKNKGFGKAIFKLGKAIPTAKLEIKPLKVILRNYAKDYEKGEIFTVDCLSDIVLPFNQISNIGKELGEFLFGNIDYLGEFSYINIQKLGGYHLQAQSRKSDELIITKGSVLSYRWDSNLVEKIP